MRNGEVIAGTLVTVSKKNFEPLTARSFKTKIRGRVFKGFVVKKDGRYYAYQNLCQHLPITLDLNDDDFFTHDKAHLQCHMHGAMYEIESGQCIAGPCQGTNLVALQVVEEETRLVIRVPDPFIQS